MDSTWLTYQQLVAEIQKLCTEKNSGTLFCSTVDHNSATIAIQHGQIVALGFNQGFKMMRGNTALSFIQTIQQCKISFKNTLPSKADVGLADTAGILHALAGAAAAALPKANTPQAEAPRPATGDTAPGPLSSASMLFSPDILARLRVIVQEEAHNAFGPIAMLLCEEHFARAGQLRTFTDVERLLTALATNTGAATRADAFRAKVLERLRTMRIAG